MTSRIADTLIAFPFPTLFQGRHRNRFFTLGFLLIFGIGSSVLAASKPLVSVQVSPHPQVQMSWSDHSGTVHILRRDLGSTNFEDFSSVGTTSNNRFTDTTVSIGDAYEYVISTSTAYFSEILGFAVAVGAELIDERGAVLLVIDDTVSTPLAAELDLLEMDMVGDGWTVHRLEWGRHGTGDGPALRAEIQNQVADHPDINTLYFFGKLPMVESGYDQPDGHNNHQPHVTDLYYADLDGTWTDTGTFTYRTAQNLPGDGIYDQNTIPSDIELALGRVTMHSMTDRGKNEREQLRDYIHKAFAWKHAHREVPTRAVFQYTNGEHHETRAYTNAMFGGNVRDGGDIPTLSQEDPIFLGYSFSPESIGSTYTPTRVLISANFKSHRHRWWESNHIMRHVIAQPDWGLNAYWGSRPQWFFYHMSAGLPIGFSMKYSVNQFFKGSRLYQHRRVYMSLQGDPTTRMHPISPPGQVTASREGDGVGVAWSASREGDGVGVAWSASPAAHLAGYHVYRSNVKTGPYTRLTSSPIASTDFSDESAPEGVLYYQVRAVADMEDLPTGSYRNQSQGIFTRLNADGTANQPPMASGGGYHVKTDSILPVEVTGSDPDGDPVTPIVLLNPRHGQLRWQDGRVYYQSHPGYIGEDSFSFILSDGIAHSDPVTVDISVEPEGETLLAWEFVSGSGNEEKRSTWNVSGIAPSELTTGSNLQGSDPWPHHDHYAVHYANHPELDPAAYIAWTLSPESGFRTSLDRITFGLFADAHLVLNCALRVSDDGFASYDEVPLDWTSHAGQGSGDNLGILNTADLSGIARLQDTTTPLEFRLYLWHEGASTDVIGLGKITGIEDSASEDLVITGSRQRLDGTVLMVQDRNAFEVYEGESTEVRVKLSHPPAGPVTVTATRTAGGEAISVISGENLNFDADNWKQWQTITLHAAIDDDETAETTIITVGGPGTETLEITVTEGEPLIGHWRLDEETGTVAADSAIGHHGSHDGGYHGEPTPTTGQVGGARAFDGVDDRVVISDFDYTRNQEFSLAFWFRHPGLSGANDEFIFSHGSNGSSHSLNMYLLKDSGAIRTRLRDSNDSNWFGSLDTGSGLDNDTWHHYALVVDRSGSTVYINGEVARSVSLGGDAFDPNTSIRFGVDSNFTNSTRYRGLLDDVRLYRAPLTRDHIRRIVAVGARSMELSAWREFHFGDAANSGDGANTHDPGGDQISNLMKYALGMTPMENGAGHRHLPRSSVDHDPQASGSYLTVEYHTPAPLPPGADIVVETSVDLDTWLPNAILLEEDGDEPETIRYRWRSPHTINQEPAQFMRLRVTTP